MSQNFAALLDQNADDTKAPVPVPEGTYVAIITGHEFGESSQKKTPQVQFLAKLVSPMDDVDPEALAECENWNQKEIKSRELTRYLTTDAMIMLKEFLEKVCKIDTTGRTYADMIPETTNTEIVLHFSHEMVGEGDEQRPIAVVDKVAAAE